MADKSDRDFVAELVLQRYGGVEDLALPGMSPMLETVLGHRSVRRYSDAPLPAGTIEALVAAGQSASTSSNLQTWSVVAVESSAGRRAIAHLAGNQAHILEAPLMLVWIADLARLHSVATIAGGQPEALDYLELFLTACIDASLAAQNAAVAAEALGLGIVYIGAVRNRPSEMAALLHLPDRCFAVFGMCVGLPAPDGAGAIRPRLPQQAVLHRECYGDSTSAEMIDRYDGLMRQFYHEQAMRDERWSEKSARRVRGPSSMSGRHALSAILRRMGFPLR